MPTTRATRWRQRDSAIARKGVYEVDPWEEVDENVSVQTSQAPTLKSTPSSPVSVATTFDAQTTVPDVEIKPLLLPGAWVVVGKRGKPKLQNEMKMYEEPKEMVASKKKQKKKTAKKNARTTEDDPLVVRLAEASSSTSCLRALERSSAQRHKSAMRAKEAKFWASYRRAKLCKRAALHELVAALADDGRTDDETEVQAAPAPPPKTSPKDHKANSNKDKARRRARSAAAAARCFLHDHDESAPLAAEHVATSEAAARQASDEITLLVGSSAGTDTARTQPEPPEAWRTVGKGGKVLRMVPQLEKAKGDEPNEAPPSKSFKRDKKKGTSYKMQCSVM